MPHDGSILIDGEAPLDLSSPRAAVRAGRRSAGAGPGGRLIASALAVRENAYLNPGASGRGLLSFLGRGAEARKATALGASVGLRPNAPELPIEGLGRQSTKSHRRPLAGDGTPAPRRRRPNGRSGRRRESGNLPAHRARARSELAVAVVSTDFEEDHICHRALVFNRGRIIAELSGSELTTELVIAAASASEAA